MEALPLVLEQSEGQVSEMWRFIKSSGVYALASVVTPFISLLLAPFLTHILSTTDYGILTLLNTIIGLVAGVTQLGMGAAFFRAYNYDYTTQSEKRCVISTMTVLLFLSSLLTIIGTVSAAPFLASHLLQHASQSRLIIIAAGVICVQNLAVPSFAWLRAESRALFYSLLSIGNMLTMLLANIVLVGFLHQGIAGSLLATGVGYSCVVLFTLSMIIFRVGIRVRLDIAHNLLGFGMPLIISVVSYWILQLSDRYLLSRLSSLAETARYGVAYTLGTVISVVIMGPFTLAWPKTMFSIARSKNAAHIFQMVFRWFGLFLLLSAFSLSSLGILLLHWFFPVTYSSAAFVIPIVSVSIVFYGIYHFFMIGANIQRKTWMNSVFTTLAAVANLLLNLCLIPRYGAMGAALSTLIAYIVLALSAYIVNQKIYPIAFEMGRFVLALLPGVALYLGSSLLVRRQGIYLTVGIDSLSVMLYALILLVVGLFPAKAQHASYKASRDVALSKYQPVDMSADEVFQQQTLLVGRQIVMHIRGSVRSDMRVLREATALVQAGCTVTIVDIEGVRTCPAHEVRMGIHIEHLFPIQSMWPLLRTPFKVRLLLYSVYRLLTIRADAYHAHDISALPACYIAARLRQKALIFDAHELPMSNMSPHWRRFSWIFKGLLTHILPRCAGVITVSPPIGQALCALYHAPEITLVRNFPTYQEVTRSDRLRQRLGLGPEARIVLYQGNIQADRSLEMLVMAAPFLKPDTVIVLLGWADEATRQQLDDLIAREEMQEHVKILPAVPYEELLQWTASADIGLVLFSPDYSLSIRWCLPNKLFEYLMAGLPVLASSLDAVEAMLRDYEVGQIVPSLSPAEIGVAIEAMLADRTTLERMRANALSAARRDLCWEQEQWQVVRLYQSILCCPLSSSSLS
ncbi:hypothetical protein KDI_36420 [Dictyobacter arantiisoli]|uniref:Polysaccharide biosynthesis protein C-terminal domain-containing protein n=2 Tax=Dictyobacter arantiisoli TaxID=2014874 RepID=A0A5A5TFQ8_9CHLR|nr:hypothetical protein KDI_36420 [Dictyobacter arantiisoli]